MMILNMIKRLLLVVGLILIAFIGVVTLLLASMEPKKMVSYLQQEFEKQHYGHLTLDKLDWSFVPELSLLLEGIELHSIEASPRLMAKGTQL